MTTFCYDFWKELSSIAPAAPKLSSQTHPPNHSLLITCWLIPKHTLPQQGQRHGSNKLLHLRYPTATGSGAVLLTAITLMLLGMGRSQQPSTSYPVPGKQVKLYTPLSHNLAWQLKGSVPKLKIFKTMLSDIPPPTLPLHSPLIMVVQGYLLQTDLSSTHFLIPVF